MTTQENAMTDQQRQKVDAEIAKLIAETAKLNRETSLYPVVVGASLALAIVAVVKLFL